MAGNNYKPSAFWFGFALGTMVTGASVFLFGTKKGRSTMKKVMELTENLEENAISLFQELEERLETKTPETKSPGTLDTVINRMKHLVPETKSDKKFFTKE